MILFLFNCQKTTGSSQKISMNQKLSLSCLHRLKYHYPSRPLESYCYWLTLNLYFFIYSKFLMILGLHLFLKFRLNCLHWLHFLLDFFFNVECLFWTFLFLFFLIWSLFHLNRGLGCFTFQILMNLKTFLPKNLIIYFRKMKIFECFKFQIKQFSLV